MTLNSEEHIIDIETTFSFSAITSIFLKTNQGRFIFYGSESLNTSISKLDVSSSPEVNVIFGFETTFSSDCLKELFVYRGYVFQQNEENKCITAEKYQNMLKKKNCDDSFADWNKINDKNNNSTPKSLLPSEKNIGGGGVHYNKVFCLNSDCRFAESGDIAMEESKEIK